MTNSASGHFTGPVVQVGTVRGDVHAGGSGPVRSHYLTRVESLAPPSLVDREDELAELARFCTSPDTEGAYAWWQADAWSGKSALLTTFVLNPPPGVRLVAFFITGSQPGQSDRRAFVDNVLEQLCAVRGTPLPPSTDATREAQLRGLLAEVAQDCRRRGEQFALVVDGLDEDLGRDGSPDGHSIAALLPVQPPGPRARRCAGPGDLRAVDHGHGRPRGFRPGGTPSRPVDRSESARLRVGCRHRRRGGGS
ncbi:peptidase C14, caspase catalytic subunit P20 [Amycolatopsis vancoresmycina DSM 44592]|uniref:Peptidase C14, caspase catalytic subunit P20 n=1 Tax=Amycolatopsis vancoresmycina DSM 44592 TaxID=1292037 RepID=R1I9B1_9PSEU|nr:peptidase C14, caspase catalytic subunit P20 [Amycolatopsis vancoresmycina DSM 44592]